MCHLLDKLKVLHHSAEHHVLPVQPGSLHRGDKELGAVCVFTGVRHREKTRSVMTEYEVLIIELVPIDRLSTGAVTSSEVSSLE